MDWAIGCALRRDLSVVIDDHHDRELCADAERHAPRFLALWEQIARRYAGASERLCFELLNEPHDPLTARRWNDLLAEALAVVRTSNPDRTVIVGPARWNIVDALPTLRPPADEHLMLTVHYYSPFRFTHQGADWLEGAGDWLGTGWGTASERARTQRDLERAAAWASAQQHELFLGEFGVLDNADAAARAAWTKHVREAAERLGVGWAYWDFATDFGAFDVSAHAWRPALKDALLGDPGSGSAAHA